MGITFLLLASSFLSFILQAKASAEFFNYEEMHVAQVTTRVTRFIELDVLVVICTNTAGGSVDPDEIAKLKEEVTQAEEFFWRNSRLKLDLNISYLIIDRYISIDEFWEVYEGGYWLGCWSIERDLRNSSIVDNQYDGIVVFYGWGENEYGAAFGGGTYGVDFGFLGKTGYTAIPLCWDPDTYDWFFIHEFNHQVDSMFEASGLREYPSSDIPWELKGDFGENYDFNAYILRSWPVENWFKLIPPWGRIIEAEDNDQDGVPDGVPGLTITEAILGSNNSSYDSDNDGLSDLEEVIAGIYSGSDPLNPDTDGDGIIDGIDPYPLYPIKIHHNIINRKDIVIDGELEGDWDLFIDYFNYAATEFSAPIYVNWNEEYLFIAFKIKGRYARPQIYLDAANDGWFHGRDNYEIIIDPSGNRVELAHIWDCSNEIIGKIGYPMWDDDANYPFDPIINESDIIVGCSGSDEEGYVVEVAIPRSPRSGLTLKDGKIGLRFIFHYIDRVGGVWATVFEHETFCDICIDTTPPIGFIIINNNNTYTNSTLVKLTLNVTDPASGIYQVRFSNDGVWDTEQWEDYTVTKDWILPEGDGVKTVYVQFMDKAGLISETCSDIIVLDTVNPIIFEVKRWPEGDIEANMPVKILVNATDALSGLGGLLLLYNINNNFTWINITMILNATTRLYEATIPAQPANTSVKYKIIAYDNAGNRIVEDNNGQYYTYTVIPIFPSTFIFLLLMMATLIATVLRKTQRKTFGRMFRSAPYK
jgi:hypothetical protein